MSGRKKLRSYMDVVAKLKENGGKIKLTALSKQAQVKGLAYSYGFSFSPLLVYLKDGNLHGDALMTTAWCRGFHYEALIKNYKNQSYDEHTPERLKQMPCAAFVAFTKKSEPIFKIALPIINDVERRAGWVPTKVYRLGNNGRVLIIGSKKWLRSAPLISAYFLMFRHIIYNCDLSTTPEENFERLKGKVKLGLKDLEDFYDESAYKRLFYKDSLHILMKRSHLTGNCGKKLYKDCSVGGGTGHSNGIGDCLGAVFAILELAKRKDIRIKDMSRDKVKKMLTYRAPTHYVTHAFEHFMSTTALHYNMIIDLAVTLQEKELEQDL